MELNNTELCHENGHIKVYDTCLLVDTFTGLPAKTWYKEVPSCVCVLLHGVASTASLQEPFRPLPYQGQSTCDNVSMFQVRRPFPANGLPGRHTVDGRLSGGPPNLSHTRIRFAIN